MNIFLTAVIILVGPFLIFKHFFYFFIWKTVITKRESMGTKSERDLFHLLVHFPKQSHQPELDHTDHEPWEVPVFLEQAAKTHVCGPSSAALPGTNRELDKNRCAGIRGCVLYHNSHPSWATAGPNDMIQLLKVHSCFSWIFLKHHSNY